MASSALRRAVERWAPVVCALALALGLQATTLAGPERAHAGTGPLAYVVLEDGQDTCSFGRLDLTTGDITVTGTPGGATCVTTMTFAPDGTLYGVTGLETLVRIDLTTGVGTEVGPIDISVLLPAGGLAFDRSGALWYYEQSLDPECSDFSCLYRIDPTDASDTFVGGGGSETIVSGLAGRCDGRVLTIHGAPPQQLASVDTATGGLIDLGPTNPTAFVNDLATESDGTLWALATPPVGSGVQVQQIDPDGPTVVDGPLLSGDQPPIAFAIAPLSCPEPPAPEPPAPATITPTFTG